MLETSRRRAALAVFAASGVAALAQEPAAAFMVPQGVTKSLRANRAEERIAGLKALAEHAQSVGKREREFLSWHCALLLADPADLVQAAAVESLLTIVPGLNRHRDSLQSLREFAPRRGGGAQVRNGARLFVGDLSRLSHPSPEARMQRVREVCRSGESAAEFQYIVLGLLDDPDLGVRCAVARDVAMLGWNDVVAGQLVRALRAVEPELREAAAAGLRAQESPQAIGALRGALQDPSVAVRVRVLQSLATSGAKGEASAADLIAMLRDSEASVRIAALQAMAALEVSGERAVREVGRCLDRQGVHEAMAALRAVEAMGPDAEPLFDRALAHIDLPGLLRPRQAFAAAWAVAASRAEQRGRLAVLCVERLAGTDDYSLYARHLLHCWLHP